MSDIVKRLRTYVACDGGDLFDVAEAADEITRLRDQLARAREFHASELADMTAERDALRAQVAALEVDAGRYRYLRSSDWECFDHEWLREMDMPSDTGLSYVVHEEALDAAIDAALGRRRGDDGRRRTLRT